MIKNYNKIKSTKGVRLIYSISITYKILCKYKCHLLGIILALNCPITVILYGVTCSC